MSYYFFNFYNQTLIKILEFMPQHNETLTCHHNNEHA